jgi:hypothetical protein
MCISSCANRAILRSCSSASPGSPSYDELQRAISRELHGKEWKTFRVPKPLAKLGAWLQEAMPGPGSFIKPWMIDLADDHYALDIRRAREVLGWEPRHSLRETLPKIIEALKSDPPVWYKENKLASKQPPGPAWPNVANMFLGLWLLGTAPAFGITQQALLWSDLASGAAAILFGALAMRHRWAAWAASLVGLWLMAAPSLLGASGFAADSTHIAGALVATIAIVAMAEPARLVRYCNVLLGLWLMVAPWLIHGGASAWHWSSIFAGAVLAVLSFPRGWVEDRYGGWQRWIR